MVALAGGADRVAAIGITNQRETVVAWDRRTGEPLAPAIVWQDRRTAGHCAALREAGEEEAAQRRTGLVLAPYFSATNLRWLLDHAPVVAEAGTRLVLASLETRLYWKRIGRGSCRERGCP